MKIKMQVRFLNVPALRLALGLVLSLAPAGARAGVCAANLTNRADVMLATPGNNYDVDFDIKPTTVPGCPTWPDFVEALSCNQ